jgi:hypothetical protein
MFLTDGLATAARRREMAAPPPPPVAGAALLRVLFVVVLVAVILAELLGPHFGAPAPHEQIFTFGGWDTLSLFAAYVLFVALYADPRRRIAVTALGILFSVLVAGGLALTGEPVRFHFSTLGAGFSAGTLVMLVADIALSRDGVPAIDAVAVCLLLPLSASLTAFGFWLTEIIAPMTYDGYILGFERTLGVDAEVFVYRHVQAMPWARPLIRYAYVAVPLAVAAFHIVQVRLSGTSNMLAMFVLSTFVAFCLYLVFPVVGPAYAIPGFPEPLAMVQNLPPQPIEADPLVPRNCMPSMHTAWALILVFGARPLPKPMRLAAMAFLVLTLIATLSEFGSHWFIDLVVAFPFAVAVHAVFVDALPWRTRVRWPAIAIGALLTLAWLVLLRFGSPIWQAAPWLSWPLVVATILSALLLETALARTIAQQACSHRSPVSKT